MAPSIFELALVGSASDPIFDSVALKLVILPSSGQFVCSHSIGKYAWAVTHSIFEFADVDHLLREVEQLTEPIELPSLKLASIAPDFVSFFLVEDALAVVLAIGKFTRIML